MTHKIFGTDGNRVTYENPEFYRRQAAEAMAWQAVARVIPGIESGDYDHYDLWCEVRTQARLLGSPVLGSPVLGSNLEPRIRESDNWRELCRAYEAQIAAGYTPEAGKAELIELFFKLFNKSTPPDANNGD